MPLRFGVGLSYIVSPKAKAMVDGREQEIKFKNAIGRSFEIGYQITPDVWTNVRLSSEKFEPKAAGTANESVVWHLSLNVSYVF
jgi:outer membrane protein W